jgi:transposase InsO family protein
LRGVRVIRQKVRTVVACQGKRDIQSVLQFFGIRVGKCRDARDVRAGVIAGVRVGRRVVAANGDNQLQIVVHRFPKGFQGKQRHGEWRGGRGLRVYRFGATAFRTKWA